MCSGPRVSPNGQPAARPNAQSTAHPPTHRRVAQVLHFLTTPNAALKQKLRAAREALGRMRPPVLSLHVRKGDACSDRDECHSLSDSLPVVRQMMATYGYRTVFLATPDQTVLEELRHLSSSIDFRFLPTWGCGIRTHRAALCTHVALLHAQQHCWTASGIVARPAVTSALRVRRTNATESMRLRGIRRIDEAIAQGVLVTPRASGPAQPAPRRTRR